MGYMFARCDALTEIDLSNWTIDAATLVEGMFYQSTSLKKINLKNATFRSVYYASSIFKDAKKLEEIDLRSAVFSTRTSASLNNVFTGIPTNCLIIVKNETEKAWVLAQRSDLTNVKTVAEYEAIL